MKEYVRTRTEPLIKFWRRYEHHLGVGALMVGFIFDLIVAKKPDSVFDNILLCSYLFIAGAVIVLLNLRARRVDPHSAEPLVLLLMLQFCFGGLASNLLVLYGKSGTLTGSAIFIGMLVCLVFGNEYLRSRYSQLRFNVIVYYFLLLTYSIIAAPTFIFHAIGDGVFLASGGLSLIAISAFLAILYFAVLRGDKRRQLNEIAIMVGIVFVIFNGLYFLNVIPPVPLSLKDIGVYHSILKYSSGDYLALYEPAPWYVFWRDTSASFTFASGQSAYCFSSVYAPADLSTPIYHHWEHYNQATQNWDTISRVSFPISGGRADGYRGFSTTAALSAGQWRCDVETSSGALIGRIEFTAVEGSTTLQLSQVTL
jgi:hypothetical protein